MKAFKQAFATSQCVQLKNISFKNGELNDECVHQLSNAIQTIKCRYFTIHLNI